MNQINNKLTTAEKNVSDHENTWKKKDHISKKYNKIIYFNYETI